MLYDIPHTARFGCLLHIRPEPTMPFFKNAEGVQVNGGQFYDIDGDKNTVDHSKHVYRDAPRVTPPADIGASKSPNSSSSTGKS